MTDYGSLKKFHMAPCRAFVPLPFPMDHAGSCLVVSDAMPASGEQHRGISGYGTSKLC
jgi:hypothetical protein